jgi:hypothetical protein
MYEQFRGYDDRVKKIHIEEIDMNYVDPEVVEQRSIRKFKKHFQKWKYGKEWFFIDDINKARKIIKNVNKNMYKLAKQEKERKVKYTDCYLDLESKFIALKKKYKRAQRDIKILKEEKAEIEIKLCDIGIFFWGGKYKKLRKFLRKNC